MSRKLAEGRRGGVPPGPRLPRRSMLAAGAAGLGLPLLDSLRREPTSLGGARARAADGAPKRLILLYTANGTYPTQWFPTAVRSSTDFDLGPILSPLADYQQNLVLIRGMHNEVATNPANNGGPHQRGMGGLFTGQMLQTGEFRDGCGSTAGWADGLSVDQRIAQLIGFETPFGSLELGVRSFSDDVQGRISYAAAGAPLPPISSPTAAWERLFGASTAESTSEARKTAVLDAVRTQYAHLSGRVSAGDREKLSQHLALVEDLERRMDLIDAPGEPACAATPSAPDELIADSEETMPQVSRAQIDLITAAFACDLTRVASLQYSTGFNRIRYPWLESYSEGHTLSHSGDSNLEAWEELGQRQKWHAEEVKYLVDRLAQIPEGEGSLLDNTLIVWGTEVSQGNSHSLEDIPFLLLGGDSVGLRGGQFLEMMGRSHGELLLSMVRMFGGTDEHFGHPDHGDGLLEEILA